MNLNSEEVAVYLASLFKKEYLNYGFKVERINYENSHAGIGRDYWQVVAIGECGDFKVAYYCYWTGPDSVGWRIPFKAGKGIATVGLENEEEIIEAINGSELVERWLPLKPSQAFPSRCFV